MAYKADETIDEALTDGIVEVAPELPTYNALSTVVYNNLTRVSTGMNNPDEAQDTGVVNRVVDVNRSISTQTVKHSERAINDSAKAPNLKTAHELESRGRWVQFAISQRHELVNKCHEI